MFSRFLLCFFLKFQIENKQGWVRDGRKGGQPKIYQKMSWVALRLLMTICDISGQGKKAKEPVIKRRNMSESAATCLKCRNVSEMPQVASNFVCLQCPSRPPLLASAKGKHSKEFHLKSRRMCRIYPESSRNSQGRVGDSSGEGQFMFVLFVASDKCYRGIKTKNCTLSTATL